MYFIRAVNYVLLRRSKAIIFVQDYGPDIDFLLFLLVDKCF